MNLVGVSGAPMGKGPSIPKCKQGVCHKVALPFRLKFILRQKKNYRKFIENLWKNSIISPCKNIIFQKNPLKETKNLQDVITL
jgi:hypothetical protein